MLKKYSQVSESKENNDALEKFSKLLEQIEKLSPEIEEIFSDDNVSGDKNVSAVFKNLQPIVRSNKEVKEQMYVWLNQKIAQIQKDFNAISSTVERMKEK